MSQHWYRRRLPPVGVSSFTKIRLGWISRDQVLSVDAGETACAFLSPLAVGGSTLAVKIRLDADNYYLVENRQPIGSDRILPDFGALILQVRPGIRDGAGPVRVMDADPSAANFERATYRLDKPEGTMFVDQENDVVVIPLWSEDERLGILVTTREQSSEALEAALMIYREQQRRESSGEAKERLLKAVAAFRNFDFHESLRISRAAFTTP